VTTILIGVDASERSAHAIAFTRHLAQASGAHVVIANAYPYPDRAFRGANGPSREVLRDEALETVRAMRERLDLPEDRSTIKIAANASPAHALRSMAHAEDASLLVVGSTHTGRAGRVFPGSTAERLLHGAPCTVAVVPADYAARAIRRIGVAVDGSPESRSAAAAAAALARGLDAELVVIGVAEPFLYEVDTPVDGQTAADIVRAAQADLDALVDELPVDATTALLTGEAAELLAEYSRHVDLLVTGSRGYGPARSVLVGGVSGRLMRSTQCPVLIVPRGVAGPPTGLFDALVGQA
jgi:nucleotide-binding universal stress UspA family protein